MKLKLMLKLKAINSFCTHFGFTNRWIYFKWNRMYPKW